MQVIGLSEYGGPEVLRPRDLPEPHAGPGQVRVRVRAAGVNPVDAMLRQGLLAKMNHGIEPPYVPGMEVAGTIDEIGDRALAGLSPGAEVVAIVDNLGSHGGYSDLVVVPAASVTAMPNNSTFTQSASFLNNALTARNALDALALPSGSTLVVTGAAGSVGGFLTELAASEGLEVIAVAADADEALVRGFGAKQFLARGDNVADRVRALVSDGVDAVIDAALLLDRIVPAIRDRGQLGLLRPWPAGPVERDIAVHELNVRQRATDHAAITRLREQVEAGMLTLRVGEILPAASAVQAHRLLDRGGLRGRIILQFPVQEN